MNLFVGREHVENELVDPIREGEGETNRENSTDTYKLPCAKQMASGKLLITQGAPLDVL